MMDRMAKKAAGKKRDVSNEDMFEVLVFLKDKVERIADDVDDMKGTMVTTGKDIKELRERVTSLEKGQEEILDTLLPLSKAYDKDSVVLMNHETRIARLEKARV